MPCATKNRFLQFWSSALIQFNLLIYMHKVTFIMCLWVLFRTCSGGSVHRLKFRYQTWKHQYRKENKWKLSFSNKFRKRIWNLLVFKTGFVDIFDLYIFRRFDIRDHLSSSVFSLFALGLQIHNCQCCCCVNFPGK